MRDNCDKVASIFGFVDNLKEQSINDDTRLVFAITFGNQLKVLI